jgi:hypothetical protein
MESVTLWLEWPALGAGLVTSWMESLDATEIAGDGLSGVGEPSDDVAGCLAEVDDPRKRVGDSLGGVVVPVDDVT